MSAPLMTALNAAPDALDEGERHFVDIIRKHGWFRTNVLEDEENVGFSYSTGWWLSTGQPELILFGIRSESAGTIFWDLYRDAVAGDHLESGVRTDRAFKGLPAYTFEVSRRHYPEYLGWSRWFYGGDSFPCYQLVWPDRNGLFPWEHGADPAFSETQPDLTENGWRAAVRD